MLRDIAYVLSRCEKTQFEIVWDNDLKAINLITNTPYTIIGNEMSPYFVTPAIILPNNSRVYIDGRFVFLRSYNVGGNNFFRLRDLGMALDFEVDWDRVNEFVVIIT